LHKRIDRTVFGSKKPEQAGHFRLIFRGISAFIMAGIVGLLAFVLAVIASAAAQGSPEPQTGASRVALATVTDPRNKPLVDVGADDFVIQEAGVSRDILSVRPADYPIVVLLDTGSEARADLALMQAAATHFLERIGQRPIALGTFGGAPKMLATFEDERKTVLTRIAETAVDASGGSLLLEGAALAGRTIRDTGTLFSAIVILSATSADASRSPADEIVAPIVDSNAILHIVANRSTPRPSRENRDLTPLRALAEQSRGEFTVIYSASSYQAALDRLADRLTAEMLIEYLVPVGSKPNDVKVGVRIVGARVRGLGVAPR
jgi:hypothetical protein